MATQVHPGTDRRDGTARPYNPIVAAGYQEIDLLPYQYPRTERSWIQGYVLDPRPYPQDRRTLLYIFLTTWLAVWFVALLPYLLPLGGPVPQGWQPALIPLGIALAAATTLVAVVGRVRNSRNLKALRAYGMPTSGGVDILVVAPPPDVLEDYETARNSGLFNRVQVLAPQEFFQKVTVGDPVIFGEKDGITYLIRAFDYE